MDILTVQKKLRLLLAPAAASYAMLMHARRLLFSRNMRSAFFPSKPCVAVGNIAWGGTGKTPFSGGLLDWAAQKHLQAVVLTRGYKGQKQPAPLLVDAGMSPEQAGDEPVMLAGRHPDAKIVVFPKRSQSAAFAEKKLAPDLFILDDGMQHLQVARDMNLVLLRPEDLLDQWDRVIPAGSWREGKDALQAASAFLMKILPEDLPALLPAITSRLESFGVPLFTFSMMPEAVVPISRYPDTGATNTGSFFLPQDLAGKEYAVMTALGSPGQALDTVQTALAKAPSRTFLYPDHHSFTKEDIAECSVSGLPLLCTEKDAVKLKRLAPAFPDLSLFVFTAKIIFGPCFFSATDFPVWWEQWWQSMQPKPTETRI